MRPRLVLATANPDKARELAGLLEGFEVVPRPVDLPDVEETADTLEGNARLKAAAVMEATGELAVADDTGLEVDELDGRPGVRAARYAGPDATYADNVAKLLAELADLPAAERTARFRTVTVAVFPTGARSSPRAQWKGRSPSGLPATAASATTRCSCPRAATGGRSPR